MVLKRLTGAAIYSRSVASSWPRGRRSARRPRQTRRLFRLAGGRALTGALSKHLGLDNVPLRFVGISQTGRIVPIFVERSRLHSERTTPFQFRAMNDRNFWKMHTHTKEQVADDMKSAPYRADDTNSRSSLSN